MLRSWRRANTQRTPAATPLLLQSVAGVVAAAATGPAQPRRRAFAARSPRVRSSARGWMQSWRPRARRLLRTRPGAQTASAACLCFARTSSMYFASSRVQCQVCIHWRCFVDPTTVSVKQCTRPCNSMVCSPAVALTNSAVLVMHLCRTTARRTVSQEAETGGVSSRIHWRRIRQLEEHLSRTAAQASSAAARAPLPSLGALLHALSS